MPPKVDPNRAPTTEQLRALRRAVKDYARAHRYDEPWAYVKLCAAVLGSDQEPHALTADECDRIVAHAKRHAGGGPDGGAPKGVASSSARGVS